MSTKGIPDPNKIPPTVIWNSEKQTELSVLRKKHTRLIQVATTTLNLFYYIIQAIIGLVEKCFTSWPSHWLWNTVLKDLEFEKQQQKLTEVKLPISKFLYFEPNISEHILSFTHNQSTLAVTSICPCLLWAKPSWECIEFSYSPRNFTPYILELDKH